MSDFRDTETEAVRVLEGPCDTCRHRDPDQPSTCKAFPDGIPIDIIIGKHDHRTPIAGDHGIRWTPRPAETTEGPVRYVLVDELDKDGWTNSGAIWAAPDRDAGGFIPSPGTSDETAWRWELELRRAWRDGYAPFDVVEAWDGRGGAGAVVGRDAQEAARLADLLQRLDG